MKRRAFLVRGSLLTTGYTLMKTMPLWAGPISPEGENAGAPDGARTALPAAELYRLFKDPTPVYRPFVRWWWNGDKVEKAELARELRLMKDAGIGGVEINPIKFPPRTDDLGKPAIQWLSPEWIDLLQFTLKEAESLGLTCDLIVGSGWPFGAEYLRGEERSQVVLIGTHKLEGPLDYEVSLFDLFKEADPAVTSPFAGRRMEMLSVQLVPAKLNSMDQVQDLSAQIKEGGVTVKIPDGKYVLYGLVKVTGSMEVINGAPGANGPVLNHYNEAAVNKYLNHMSDTIQRQIGPLAGRVRSFFSDSMELEGSNWSADMADEFKKRRGYDLMPWLPFTMFKTGPMGNIYDFNYGAELGEELRDKIERVRYDFDLTKSQLIRERFIKPFTQWCRDNKIQSRIQAYGRGYFPLEGSFDVDLPECETWIKYGLGKEMSESDYRIGRAYTMINKYVSSAAHLNGKRHISCEELTNTDMVFNDTLEILKVAGDQSAISGVTHPVFHGFNYSPPTAPFPGWVRYGTYFNEKNTWWPYFRRFTDYKARYSALLQQGDMFADIAVLPPVSDMWSIYGAQNEPFPSLIYPAWQTLIWESIHQNGNACDYVSEEVLRQSETKDGKLLFGTRKYHTIFLIKVERLEPATAEKLFNFVAAGGRIFCIDSMPVMSVGLQEHAARDIEVQSWVTRMKAFPDRFILLKKPESNFGQWYRDVQQKYKITPYVNIDKPNPFVTQVRYQGEGLEWLLFTNSHLEESHTLQLSFSKDMTAGRQVWIWDAETGDRYRVETGAEKITLDLGPADSKLLVFDKEKKGVAWKPAPVGPRQMQPADGETSSSAVAKPLAVTWSVEFHHIDGSVKTTTMDSLKDLKDTTDFVNFSGTAIYRTSLTIADKRKVEWLNLGKVAGVSELTVNGQDAGVQWYGRRIYHVAPLLRNGENTLEVKVTTVMGNYMKTLKDNAVAQYWTNENRKNQPLQSMGLIGPVAIY
ncbi:MAG TPA: glycosyl hydrolase [Puia sp.]|nr:glycosyl hydrolase [Puia sp.]